MIMKRAIGTIRRVAYFFQSGAIRSCVRQISHYRIIVGMRVLIGVFALVLLGSALSSVSVQAADRDSIEPIVAPPTDPATLRRIEELEPGEWLVVSAFGDADLRRHGEARWVTFSSWRYGR